MTWWIFALLSAWLGMRNWMLLLAALVAPVVLLHVSRTGMDTTYDYRVKRPDFTSASRAVRSTRSDGPVGFFESRTMSSVSASSTQLVAEPLRVDLRHRWGPFVMPTPILLSPMR